MGSRSISIEKGEELQKILKEEKPGPLRERLLFLKCVQDNFDDVKFACQTFQIGDSTGYEWIAKWNHLGIEGLKGHAIPGRPKSLGEKELDILKSRLEGRIWQTTEVRDLIKQLLELFRNSLI